LRFRQSATFLEVALPNRALPKAVLAALALAACVDNQAPDTQHGPSSQTRTSQLPILSSARVVQPAAASAGGDFTITLRFVNPPTDAQRAFFETAAAKWQGIITGDLPDVSGKFSARTCSPQIATPGFKGTIDDVLIDVLLQPIDGEGAVLGASGPCLVRTADGLSVYGVMFFDTADLQFLEDLGLFDEVVVHEMGHVLGFGSLWNFGRNLLEGSGTADPRFTGPLAISAYDRLGGTGTVPVEGDFGPGTANSHWDEDTFDNELMTGFLNLGDNPLSALTVASMGDLGYVINDRAGDRYKLPRTGPASVSASEARTQRMGLDIARREQLIRPVAAIE
jgi:Leishmanolysin